MQAETLKFIDEALTAIGLNYEFHRFKSDVSSINQWWVGEYQEIEPMNEDGQEDSSFILTGTSRGSWYDLEQSKNLIKDLFPVIGGNVATLDNGSVVAIFYETGTPIPTADADLKRIKINLRIKEWKGN